MKNAALYEIEKLKNESSAVDVKLKLKK